MRTRLVLPSALALVGMLLVHPHDDRCGSTPYAEARYLSKRFPLVSVKGGCRPSPSPARP